MRSFLEPKMMSSDVLFCLSNDQIYPIYYNVRQRQAANYPIWEAWIDHFLVFLPEKWLKQLIDYQICCQSTNRLIFAALQRCIVCRLTEISGGSSHYMLVLKQSTSININNNEQFFWLSINCFSHLSSKNGGRVSQVSASQTGGFPALTSLQT